MEMGLLTARRPIRRPAGAFAAAAGAADESEYESMKLSTTAATLGGVCLVALAAAAVSLAQPGPGDGAHPDRAAMMQHQMEEHAAHMRAILQLRPDQEAALQALQAAMKPPEGMMDHRHGGPDEMDHLSTPERLDRMAIGALGGSSYSCRFAG